MTMIFYPWEMNHPFIDLSIYFIVGVLALILLRLIDRSGLKMAVITSLAFASFTFAFICFLRSDSTYWYLAFDMLIHASVLWFGGFIGVLLSFGFAPRT